MKKLFNQRIFLVCLIVILCCALSGCFHMSMNITVKEDGSMHNEMIAVGAEIMKDDIEELKKDIIKNNKDVKVEPYKDGEMSGYKFVGDVSSIEEYAKNNSGEDKTTTQEYRAVKGWFYDAYSFNILNKGNKEMNNSEDREMAKAMLSDIKFDYTLNLPYAADMHNADSATNGNKTLYWNLAETVTSSSDKSIRAEFKIWHKGHVFMTVAVIIVLLLIAFTYLNKSKNANDMNVAKKYKNWSSIALLLAVILGGMSGYMMFSTPKFSDNTIIGKAPVTQAATDNNTTTATAQPAQPAPSNSAAAKAEQELHQKGVQGTVLASSVGHNGSGYLSLVKTNNGQYQIVTYDTKNGRVGITPYDRNILYFTDKKPQGTGNETVIFNITIQNDIHDNDKNAGAWEGNNHNIPIFANYKFDGSGNVVPGMLTTGKGAKPSHYQEYFYEPRNVDTINLFLTEIIALQKNIADNKVTLP